MPRRSILSATERESLFTIPAVGDELIRLYTFNEADLALIRQHRGAQNRLGFAVLLCYMRYPGILLGVDAEPSPHLLTMVANELKVPREAWNDYGRQRAETRREHLLELQATYGFQSFTTLSNYRAAVHSLGELAMQSDKGIVLASALADSLRGKGVLPATGTRSPPWVATISVMRRVRLSPVCRSLKRMDMRACALAGMMFVAELPTLMSVISILLG